jgi:predicted phage terminase large subunit-like protein
MAYTLTIGTGKRYYDGTRYHVNDLYANMLKANVDGKPMYRHVVVKAISDEDDSLAHPHRLTHKVLESIRQEEISRSHNDFMFHLQMQNEPKTSGLIATDPSWLHYMSVREVPATAWRIITCDPAWKGTKNAGQGDYAAIQVWAFERRGPLVLRFLLDQVHSNEMTSLDGMNQICRLMRKWGVIDVSIEEIGGYIFSTDLEQQCTARGLPFNLLENKARTTNKAQRIVTFLRAMQAGHVFLITEAPHLDSFKDEFLNFPQVEHDDLLDCAAQTSDPAILELYAPGIYKKPARWSDQFRPKPKKHFDTRHCAM